MTTIYKYPLEITDIQSIKLPEGYEILSVQFQWDQLCLWALVNPSANPILTTIEIIGTGHLMSQAHRQFLGTAQQFGGQLVWHVFQRL